MDRETEREMARVRQARYRAEHIDRVRAMARVWQATYRAAHPDRARAWHAANPEKVRSYQVSWRAANPDAGLASVHLRRARKIGVGGKLSRGLRAKLLLLQQGLCAVCRAKLTKTGVHMDHIMPLSKGGANDDHNIQLLCPTCNGSKHATHPITFAQSRGLLL